jgi:hypothetical protein
MPHSGLAIASVITAAGGVGLVLVYLALVAVDFSAALAWERERQAREPDMMRLLNIGGRRAATPWDEAVARRTPAYRLWLLAVAVLVIPAALTGGGLAAAALAARRPGQDWISLWNRLLANGIHGSRRDEVLAIWFSPWSGLLANGCLLAGWFCLYLLMQWQFWGG